MWATASVGHIISFPDVAFPKNGFFVTWWLSAVVFWLRRPNANVATRTSRESTCCLPKGRLRHNKREDDCSLRIRGPRAKKGRGRRFLGGGVLGEYDLGMARAVRNFFLGGTLRLLTAQQRAMRLSVTVMIGSAPHAAPGGPCILA